MDTLALHQQIRSALADLRGVLANADRETIAELVEWCGGDELEADDPFALVCVAQSTDGEVNEVDDDRDDDVFDALDVIVERLIETLEEDESALEQLLERCESEDKDDVWTQVCSILTADAGDDRGDDGEEDE